MLVRYCDDLVVMCATRQQAQAALTRLTGLLAELGLEPKAAKTRIVHLEEGGEGFDFLGSAGPGSKGERWYAWAWLGTDTPRHYLLIRRHLSSGELAFHYCRVPKGHAVSKSRLIRAAGLRWPAEENFEFGKDCLGLDQSQVRLYHAIARHTVLVMAALAICAVTAALLRGRTDTQPPPPVRPDELPPAGPGMIPLTVPEITRLLTTRPLRPGHIEHWSNWRRRHQAGARWYHRRTRLAREAETAVVS